MRRAPVLWAFLAAACTTHQTPTATAPTPKSALTGVVWQLVEFRSSDDQIGVIRPENPEAYSMTLGQDGRAALQLNCNRGTGAWTAAETEPGMGRFSLGPIATTRMLCPAPSLDEQIARHAEFVRSYVLSEGRLYLNLMADGGTYVWEPSPSAR